MGGVLLIPLALSIEEDDIVKVKLELLSKERPLGL